VLRSKHLGIYYVTFVRASSLCNELLLTEYREGSATDCGSKAVLLSGGQKNSNSMTLIRNPSYCFLVKPHIHLNTESEGAIEAALDRAATRKKPHYKRTSIEYHKNGGYNICIE
jgi:ABC-type protease/lipase transport system fused ATPase/permease subunit